MKQKEEQILEEGGFDEAQRTRLMIWGDTKLGIKGIKGRVDRIDRLLMGLVVLDTFLFLIIAGHIGLDFSGSGGLLGAIIKGIFGG